MNVVLGIIRWVLVLPASLAALMIVYALAKIFDYISGFVANFYFGPVGDTSGTIFCGFIAGCAFVLSGVATAPTGKRYVGLALAPLPALVSAAGISLCILHFFHHFGTPNFSAVLRNTSIAGGAIVAAWELYRKEVSASSPTPLATLADYERSTEGPVIDYDDVHGEGDEGDEDEVHG